MMRLLIILSLLIGVGVPASDARASISLVYDETFAQVSGEAFEADEFLVVTLGVTATAAVPGYSSTTNSVFSVVGNSANFSGSFEQSRSTSNFSLSQGQVMAQFSVDVATPFSAGGAFGASNGYTALVGFLYDFTAPGYVFRNQQVSYDAPANFTLGGLDGNAFSEFEGSLTGTLMAGHYYRWFGQGYTESSEAVDASGSVWLTLGEPTAAPEHASVVVWSLLALCMCGAIWAPRRLTTRLGA